MTVGRPVPWISWDEWAAVGDALLGNGEAAQRNAIKQVCAWRLRGRVPLGVDVTAGLVEVILADKEHVGNDAVVQTQYSMWIIRMVNGVTGAMQKGRTASSVSILAGSAGIPPALVDIRHDATHTEMPSLPMLRMAAFMALDWLVTNYWVRQKEQLDNDRNAVHSLLQELCLLWVAAHEASAANSKKKGPMGVNEDEEEVDDEENGRDAGDGPVYTGAQGRKRREEIIVQLKTLVPPSAVPVMAKALLSLYLNVVEEPSTVSTADPQAVQVGWESSVQQLDRRYPGLKALLLLTTVQQLVKKLSAIQTPAAEEQEEEVIAGMGFCSKPDLGVMEESVWSGKRQDTLFGLLRHLLLNAAYQGPLTRDVINIREWEQQTGRLQAQLMSLLKQALAVTTALMTAAPSAPDQQLPGSSQQQPGSSATALCGNPPTPGLEEDDAISFPTAQKRATACSLIKELRVALESWSPTQESKALGTLARNTENALRELDELEKLLPITQVSHTQSRGYLSNVGGADGLGQTTTVHTGNGVRPLSIQHGSVTGAVTAGQNGVRPSSTVAPGGGEDGMGPSTTVAPRDETEGVADQTLSPWLISLQAETDKGAEWQAAFIQHLQQHSCSTHRASGRRDTATKGDMDAPNTSIQALPQGGPQQLRVGKSDTNAQTADTNQDMNQHTRPGPPTKRGREGDVDINNDAAQKVHEGEPDGLVDSGERGGLLREGQGGKIKRRKRWQRCASWQACAIGLAPCLFNPSGTVPQLTCADSAAGKADPSVQPPLPEQEAAINAQLLLEQEVGMGAVSSGDARRLEQGAAGEEEDIVYCAQPGREGTVPMCDEDMADVDARGISRAHDDQGRGVDNAVDRGTVTGNGTDANVGGGVCSSDVFAWGDVVLNVTEAKQHVQLLW